MSNNAKASQLAFVKQSRDFETSITVADLSRILRSPDPILENLEVANSVHGDTPQSTYWSVFFDPEKSSLKVYSNLPASLEDQDSPKKLIHDANNLLSRLIMQLEFLKMEASSPEVSEQIGGIAHTVDELTTVLRKR